VEEEHRWQEQHQQHYQGAALCETSRTLSPTMEREETESCDPRESGDHAEAPGGIASLQGCWGDTERLDQLRRNLFIAGRVQYLRQGWPVDIFERPEQYGVQNSSSEARKITRRLENLSLKGGRGQVMGASTEPDVVDRSGHLTVEEIEEIFIKSTFRFRLGAEELNELYVAANETRKSVLAVVRALYDPKKILETKEAVEMLKVVPRHHFIKFLLVIRNDNDFPDTVRVLGDIAHELADKKDWKDSWKRKYVEKQFFARLGARDYVKQLWDVYNSWAYYYQLGQYRVDRGQDEHYQVCSLLLKRADELVLFNSARQIYQCMCCGGICTYPIRLYVCYHVIQFTCMRAQGGMRVPPVCLVCGKRRRVLALRDVINVLSTDRQDEQALRMDVLIRMNWAKADVRDAFIRARDDQMHVVEDIKTGLALGRLHVVYGQGQLEPEAERIYMY